ncbi:hypothetical protein F8388_015506 [Cannabis sativa]|uniref:Uncharacterized protein n=1 Tax=Cannabis sativa TaxID=3483 RepID=A0A7J6GIK8_CANSA|nr:hypothetical protein F8388_015506 [Cannabis sativa]
MFQVSFAKRALFESSNLLIPRPPEAFGVCIIGFYLRGQIDFAFQGQTIYLKITEGFCWKYAQKVKYKLFWDVHELSSKMEVDEDETTDDNLNSCNFQWNEQIDDIAMKSLVHEYGDTVVINDDVVPNLRKVGVGLPAEMFDDAWFKDCLTPDERPWVNYTGSESDRDDISSSSSDFNVKE